MRVILGLGGADQDPRSGVDFEFARLGLDETISMLYLIEVGERTVGSKQLDL